MCSKCLWGNGQASYQGGTPPLQSEASRILRQPTVVTPRCNFWCGSMIFSQYGSVKINDTVMVEISDWHHLHTWLPAWLRSVGRPAPFIVLSNENSCTDIYFRALKRSFTIATRSLRIFAQRYLIATRVFIMAGIRHSRRYMWSFSSERSATPALK